LIGRGRWQLRSQGNSVVFAFGFSEKHPFNRKSNRMNLNHFSAGQKLAAAAAIRRLKRSAFLLMTVTFAFAVPAAGAAETTGPKIEFASPIHDFGKVKQGEVIRHDFVVKNTGNAVLEIKDVQPGCGCTTAGNWDKRIEPGQTGIIPLQLNSTGFSGPVHKSATVTSNDPRQPTFNLGIKGDVWTPFAVSPTMAIFTVSSETETSETKVVRIVNQLEQPVTLSGVEGATSAFRVELNPVKPGKEFELKITTVPPFAASSVAAPLTIKTSSSEAPTISVLAQLIVQQPVVVTPQQLTLPAGPLPGATSYVVAVRNHGKNALVLSDAAINIPGGVVSVQENPADKLFHLIVKFPAGFELKAEQNVELSVKSNHPKFAVIRIPVVATPPRAASAAKVSG
jgi:hypothetical protein